MSQIHIFVSYSHDDARWFDEDKLMPRLIKSLEILGAEVWFDRRRLGGGDPWKQEIVDAIKRAHIAVLLVSRNFLNSDFIREIELPRVERRFEQGELTVVPILVGHCNWQNVRVLSRPQMVPGKPTPLISYLDSPAEWDRVQEEIFSAIERQVDRVRAKLGVAAPSLPGVGRDASTTVTRLSGISKHAPRVIDPNEKTADKVRSTSRRRPPAWFIPVAAGGLAALFTTGVFMLGAPFGGDDPKPADAAVITGSEKQAENAPTPLVTPPGGVGKETAIITPVVPESVPLKPAVQANPVSIDPSAPMPVSTPGPAPVVTQQDPPPASLVAEPAAPAPDPPAPKTTVTAKPKPSTPKPVQTRQVQPQPQQPKPQPATRQKPKEVAEDAAVDFLKGKLNKALGN